ncbi:NAD(P)/FAD-dependent oxidoreductase [Salegentibacter sp. HM20]
MIDSIVVGLGLSGLAVCESLERNNREFVVFDADANAASKVAAGIFNPVILKRLKLAWDGKRQFETALDFYENLQAKLEVNFIHRREIYRKFHSVEEQNNWFEASDKPGLGEFLDDKIEHRVNSNLKADFGFGRVKNTGNLDTVLMLNSYRRYMLEAGKLQEEIFDHNSLEITADFVKYNGIKARNLIFCEGFGLSKNPFFNYLPLQGNKGEYIVIASEELKLEQAVKFSNFIIPLGNDLYKVGATYDPRDKKFNTTEAAKEKILGQLKEFLKCDFRVVGQEAGIRPTTGDRRPFVGRHPEHRNLFICNGFGSRGIIMAPSLANYLFNSIEKEESLPEEIDIKRFQRRFEKLKNAPSKGRNAGRN